MSSVQFEQEKLLEKAVSEGSTYELIRGRLLQQGESLNQLTQELNQARIYEFGESELEIIGRVRVRTENNCIARDIARVGPYLVFGYNVYIGLKTETAVGDVFGLYQLHETEEGYDVKPLELTSSFLSEERFLKDFHDLYSYYKNTTLIKIFVQNKQFFAVFQIGQTQNDIRVFRWSIESDSISYIDDRGERQFQTPQQFDFSWTETTREHHISGNYPHISIEDEVFVETVNGHLTIKIENNTESGFGIYQEEVDDKNQSLADAKIHYAKLGSLILLKVLPYRENQWRYLIFNSFNHQVNRIDAIGQACIQLPEDHGVIFPGGCYLQNGELKLFGDDTKDMQFERLIKSPNGEDVLYVFYEPEEGKVGLYTYNLIRKTLSTPLHGHGFSLYDDGKAILFSTEDNEPTRVHPMQLWQTPYFSEDHSERSVERQSFFGRIGNSELVRVISELYSIVHDINEQTTSIAHFENTLKSCDRLLDHYHWLNNSNVEKIKNAITEVRKTTGLVLDEFAKVESIRNKARQTIEHAEIEQQNLLKEIRKLKYNNPHDFVVALDKLRHQRGRLVTIKEVRYIDLSQVEQFDMQLEKEQQKLSQNAVQFLQREDAFHDYKEKITNIESSLEGVETTAELSPLINELESISLGLELLTEVIGTLKLDDATARTEIIESISEIYARINQIKANLAHKSKELGSEEAVAEFGAQFTLFNQSITNAVGLSNTIDKCDENLTRLVAQLEELESRFSEYDNFLADIMAKREELYEIFEGKKQALQDERQRKIQNLTQAANRIISGVKRRSEQFTSADELNTFFASDAMVSKCRDLIGQLRELGDSTRADDIESQLKFAKDQSIRSQRDKQEIFEDGGKVIKLGRHRFSVKTQATDITIVPRQEGLAIHITGTDYFETLQDSAFDQLQEYWDQEFRSETKAVYRSEYLADQIIRNAESNDVALTIEQLLGDKSSFDTLLNHVKKFMAIRYQDGYEKGIHDHDAAKILGVLLNMRERIGLLRYPPRIRALALTFWSSIHHDKAFLDKYMWLERASSAEQLASQFKNNLAFQKIQNEIALEAAPYFMEFKFDVSDNDIALISEYLAHELACEKTGFSVTKQASELVEALRKHLTKIQYAGAYNKLLKNLHGSIDKQWSLIESWLVGLVNHLQRADFERYIPEAIAIILSQDSVKHQMLATESTQVIDDMMGIHARINNRSIEITFDDFVERLHLHNECVVPRFDEFQKQRKRIVDNARVELKIKDFEAKPLSSFVRNELINDVYFPIIGDNLAKQMGTVGEGKRTDLMGLLLLISPPGYGKTTLMEYIANRMGLIFMKINCPSLGHNVYSLDPSQAPNATARQELEKLNLSLEMGNNVMLYLDDIQHTHPEFLQKFISLCDGSRKIEGVWRNQSKTYSLRGKKFCVVMAGNPYTESGETFKIPDMLANRADIYNLGDILSGNERQFAQSYIENCLTSNMVLAPLATRNRSDIMRFLQLANDQEVADSEFEYSYSRVEIDEIVGILKKLFEVRDIVLKVNQQYILSAAQDDKYRTEPPFRLQGSYRNMNKMAEKLSPLMNQDELAILIDDHYVGEAQTLTTGAEENLLKLKELSNNLSETEQQRWNKIKQEFVRINTMGGEDADSITKLANQVSSINTHLEDIGKTMINSSKESFPLSKVAAEISSISKLIENANLNVEVINQPVPGMDKVLNAMGDAITTSLLPVVSAMEHKLKLDHDIWERVKSIGEQINGLERSIIKKTKAGKKLLK